MEDLDAASLEDVASFFRTYYAPNNAVLSIVGDVEPVRVRAWVERYFGQIPANAAIPALADMTLAPILGTEIRELVEERVPLPRHFFAFRAPVMGDPRFDALEVASQILAGGKGSRLYRRLVREDRIAQDVSFFALGLVGGASMVAGQATVRPEVDPAVVEQVYEEELERLGREPVTKDELARARALIETYELEALQRVDERADRLSSYATLLDDPDMINRQLDRYLAVGAAEIQAAAAEVLRPDNRVVLTYMPAAPTAGVAIDEEPTA
jgi:predicted Zn-dependent peptidase